MQRAKERLQRLAPGELEPLGLATLDGERRLKLHHVLEICVAPEALQQRVRWRLCGVIMCVKGVCARARALRNRARTSTPIPTCPHPRPRQRGPTPHDCCCLHTKLRHGAVGVHARNDDAELCAVLIRGRRNEHGAKLAWHAIPVRQAGGKRVGRFWPHLEGVRSTHSCTPTPEPTNPMTAPLSGRGGRTRSADRRA